MTVLRRFMRPWMVAVAIWALITVGEITVLLWDSSGTCSSCAYDEEDDQEWARDVWHEGQEPR